MYQNLIIQYLYEGQHVSGKTPPIIWSLKRHYQSLVLLRWKAVERVAGVCPTASISYTSNNLPRMQNQRLLV